MLLSKIEQKRPAAVQVAQNFPIKLIGENKIKMKETIVTPFSEANNFLKNR